MRTSLHFWHAFWLLWFIAWFGVFLVGEIFCLVAGNGGTLSATIWWIEGWKDGESLSRFRDPIYWTAGHVLFGGALVLVLLWMVLHFFFRWGR